MKTYKLIKKNMKTKKIIWILKKHNSWRRWTIDEMLDPKEIWFAIDEAINRLQEYKQVIDSMKQTKEVLIRNIENSDEMLNSACWELQFANLQKDFYKSILDEVEVLLKKEVKHNLIKKVIENWKERWILDKFIHTDLIFKDK